MEKYRTWECSLKFWNRHAGPGMRANFTWRASIPIPHQGNNPFCQLHHFSFLSSLGSEILPPILLSCHLAILCLLLIQLHHNCASVFNKDENQDLSCKELFVSYPFPSDNSRLADCTASRLKLFGLKTPKSSQSPCKVVRQGRTFQDERCIIEVFIPILCSSIILKTLAALIHVHSGVVIETGL